MRQKCRGFSFPPVKVLGFDMRNNREKCKTASKDDFVGTWELESAEFRSEDGLVEYPFGKDAVGMLMYNVANNMMVQIMRNDRRNFEINSQFGGTPLEIKTAFEGYLAYFGSYEVKGDENIIIHHIDGSLFPNWTGHDQERHFELSTERLILRTPVMSLNNKKQTGVLIWKRKI